MLKKTLQIKRFISLLIIPCITYLFLGICHACNAYADGYLRWQECAYLLNGIYPIDIINRRIPPIDYIGSLSSDITTVPWAYILSNLLYPAFVSWNISRIISIILFIFLTLVTCFLVTKYFSENTFSKKECFLLCIGIFSHFGWYSSLNKLNNGMFTCLCILISMLLLEYASHTSITDLAIGFLMSIAMLKPQIALLFYLPLLFRKRYRAIILSGSILCISWGIVSIICHTQPLSILFDQFHIGTQLYDLSSFTYYGMFNFLISYGCSSTVLLIVQLWIFGSISFYIVYTLKNESVLVQCCLLSIVSLMWCYNHNMDMEILCFISICSISLLLKCNTLNCFEKKYLLLTIFFTAIPIPHTLYTLEFVPFIQRLFFCITVYIIFRHKNSFYRPLN